MPKISGLLTLALTAAMAIGPATAAPQFAGTNTAPGSGGDVTVDCSDQQYRYMPYCQMIGQTNVKQTSPALTSRRTNELACPKGDLVASGTDRFGNRLYRCVSHADRAMTFGYSLP